MSIGLAVEIASNFIQLFMFIGFLYLFFDKPEGKALRIVPFAVTSAIMLAVAAVFTVNNMTYHFLYYAVTVFILVLYSVIFLRGRLFMRIAARRKDRCPVMKSTGSWSFPRTWKKISATMNRFR